VRNPTEMVEAVACWLHFETRCLRDELFCEAYLAYPIGQFLHARYGNALRTEFAHPVLERHRNAAGPGRGDKPRVDFAVVEQDQVAVAVETKWLSRSQHLAEDILADCIRLELLAAEHKAAAFLILAGQQARFAELVAKPSVQAKPGHPRSTALLPTPERGPKVITLTTRSKHWERLYRRATARFPGVPLPERLLLSKAAFCAPGRRKVHCCVYGIQVESLPGRTTFVAPHAPAD